MFKHAVTYVDYNGVTHNEELYFHMMVPEWLDFEFNATFNGSLSDFIKQEMGSGNNRKVYTVFKLLVVNSYGRRSDDGSKFTKNPEWSEEFLNSPAWEQFFLWLTEGTEGKNGQVFFNGIFPDAMRERVEEIEKAQETAGAPAKVDPRQMSREELEAAFSRRLSGTNVVESSAL